MYVLDPIHYYVVVEAAADVMQEIQLAHGTRELPADKRIWLPESTTTGGLGSDDAGTRKGNDKAKGGAILNLLIGRVWWVGPGKTWEGAFVKPTCKKGDLILFSPRVVSHEFRIHGRSMKIVPWSECISMVREVPDDSPEAIELRRELPTERAVPIPGLGDIEREVAAAVAETQEPRP